MEISQLKQLVEDHAVTNPVILGIIEHLESKEKPVKVSKVKAVKTKKVAKK
jgi:hypothetical protein